MHVNVKNVNPLKRRVDSPSSDNQSPRDFCALRGCKSAWMTFMNGENRGVLRGKALHV